MSTEAPSIARATRPTRDLPTWVSYSQMGVWVWILGGLGASAALIRDDLGADRASGSLTTLALACGGFIAAFIYPLLTRRRGRGPTMRSGSVVILAGVGLYLWSPSLSVVFIAAMVMCVGGSFLVSGGNSFLAAHQGAAAPAALSEANALASVAGLLSPLAVGLVVAIGWGWRPGFAVVIVLLVLVELLRGRRLAAYADPAGASTREPTGRLPGRAIWSCGLLVATVGAEFCLTFWSADLLREQGGLGPAAAAASLGCVIGGMAVGRLLCSRLAQVMNPERLLGVSLVAGAVGFLPLWFFSAPLVMLASLSVVGMAAGMHWPLGIARTLRASGGRLDRASAAGGFAAAIATAVVPTLLAVLAVTVGMRTAFLLVPALLLVALVLLVARPVPART